MPPLLFNNSTPTTECVSVLDSAARNTKWWRSADLAVLKSTRAQSDESLLFHTTARICWLQQGASDEKQSRASVSRTRARSPGAGKKQ